MKAPLRIQSVDHRSDPIYWEDVRQIRNECRHFMTGSTNFITKEDQDAYRYSYDPSTTKIYLIQLNDFEPIGFLKLTKGDLEKCWFPTYCVRERYRGQGHGRFLVRLSKLLASELTLSVRFDNLIAQELYRKEGFYYVGHDEEERVYHFAWRQHDPAI